MQTFLPLNNYRYSAMVLDMRRLNKQITECYQLLNGSWPHHPAAKMWANYKASLVQYAKACFEEFVYRGGTPTHKSWAKISQFRLNGPDPPWLGNNDFHSSHRGRLLHKGNLDIIAMKMKYRKIEPVSFIQEFFDLTKKTNIRDLNVAQASSLLSHLDASDYANWYKQFGWSEKPSDNYIWPI